MVSSHAGPTVDLPSQNLAQKKKKTAPRYCGQSTNTPRGQNCHGCEDPNDLYQKWQYRGTASTNTPTQTETLPAETHDTRMPDDDKGVLCSKPHACAQPSCENNDACQMRMTDKETRHLSVDLTKTRQTRFWQISEPLSPKRCWRAVFLTHWIRLLPLLHRTSTSQRVSARRYQPCTHRTCTAPRQSTNFLLLLT